MDAFVQDILHALHITPYTGPYRKVVTRDSGEVITHWCTYVAGIGSSFSECEYKKRFKRPVPRWADQVHPYNLTAVCNVAFKHNRMLPTRRPK